MSDDGHDSKMDILAPVSVEDWTLFRWRGGHWIRDLDLAAAAELKNIYDIRGHIEKADVDGAVRIVRPGDPEIYLADGEVNKLPEIRVVTTRVTFGKGGTKPVDEYYLSEEAAIVMLTRLRTPKAMQMTRKVVRVFMAVGKLVQAVASGQLAPSLAPAGEEGQVRILALRHREALTMYAVIPGLYSEEFLRHKVEHSAAIVSGEKPVVENPLLDVQGYLQRRGIGTAERKKRSGQFGKNVKAAYVAQHGKAPGLLPRDVNGGSRDVCSYTERDRPLFDQVFAEMFTAITLAPEPAAPANDAASAKDDDDEPEAAE